MRYFTSLLAGAALTLVGLAGAAPSVAAPIWNLDIHHNQTHFPPGGVAEYWFDVANVGPTNSAGPVTLTIKLPPGQISRESVRQSADYFYSNTAFGPELKWSCPGSPGDTTIVCTTDHAIFRHTASRSLIVSVNVAPTASGDRFATAKVSGGGAVKDSPLVLEKTRIDPSPAGFGIVADSFTPDFTEPDGLTPVRSSGSHPDLFTIPFDFNSVDAPVPGNPLQKHEAEAVRNIAVDLPPGFVGAPTAVGECPAADFVLQQCPASSQVGRLDVRTFEISTPSPTTTYTAWSTGVYNIVHPRGAVTDLGFSVFGNPIHVRASLDPANRYAITTEVPDINETVPPFDQKLTLWGVPADKSHDSERCPLFNKDSGGQTSEECSTDAKPKPFLTFPSECGVDHAMRIHHYDSWENTGIFGPDIEYTLPGQTIDCEKPRFDPTVEIEPTGKQANTPTGLDVHVKVAQNENPDALATPPVKSTVVTLPEGMSFSPSFADGLQSCTPAQIGLFNDNQVRCPDASRIGEVELSTPLLPQALEGSMYLAAQNDNLFQSTFALYMAIQDIEERGVLVKIPGRIDVDSTTGQITTSFDDLPQFPFDDFTLKFRSGPRAPLVSPPTCGTHEIGVSITSYAQPTEVIDVSNNYEVSEGPGGGACRSGSGTLAPKVGAGTENPRAGSFSPFGFELSRDDSEQELSQVTAALPKGLVAKIAGIPFCPDAALVSIPTAEGTGASEQGDPACPPASQIGTLSAGLGAGPGPNYFPGKVYLAGPYKGAPLSLAVVAPGIAGPFDLGNVVVRAALRVDSETTQVTAVSDPFPTILHGVILRVRDVRLRVDRPNTTINPTSCERMSVDSRIGGVSGAIFNTSTPFQVGECASLPFTPKLTFRLFGGTKRGAHPKLRAIVRMPEGSANIARASVALPRSEFLDQSHIGTVCTRVQFAANECPAASIYGKAEAKTPLLEETLSGPIYLRSSDNLLPDLVATFRGGRIDANLVGRIDSVRGGIRNTFELVPDVPVSWATFTFLGGKKGLLINSRDLCKQTYRATAKLTAQSGARKTLRPEMRNSCKKKGRKGKKRRR